MIIEPHILLGNLIKLRLSADVGKYHYGNENEIKALMDLCSKNNEKIYPLIWCELPFKNTKTFTHGQDMEVSLNVFLATTSRKEWLNDKRQKETYDKVLKPLADKFSQMLVNSKTFDVNQREFNPNWLPNFHRVDIGTRQSPQKNTVLDYWDVLTLQFTAKVYANKVESC